MCAEKTFMKFENRTVIDCNANVLLCRKMIEYIVNALKNFVKKMFHTLMLHTFAPAQVNSIVSIEKGTLLSRRCEIRTSQHIKLTKNYE